MNITGWHVSVFYDILNTLFDILIYDFDLLIYIERINSWFLCPYDNVQIMMLPVCWSLSQYLHHHVYVWFRFRNNSPIFGKWVNTIVGTNISINFCSIMFLLGYVLVPRTVHDVSYGLNYNCCKLTRSM